jgi:hypothetical protein
MAYLQVSPLGGSRDETWRGRGDNKSFCIFEFAKTESIVKVERRFRTKYHTEPPTDKTIREWWVLMKYDTLLAYLCRYSIAGKTEWGGSGDTASDVHSWAARFESPLGHRLFWLRYLYFLSSHIIFTPKCRRLLVMQRVCPKPQLIVSKYYNSASPSGKQTQRRPWLLVLPGAYPVTYM